jgi:prepilin-type processing-associated H-X9-DG protein
MSHLHQIHTAFQGFAAANRGRIVYQSSGTWLDPDSNTVQLGSMYWYGASRWGFGDTSGLTMDGALLQPYIGTARGELIFECPSLAGTDIAAEMNTSYRGTTDGLGYGTSSVVFFMSKPWALTRVRNTSETVMATDSAYISVFTGAFTRTPFISWPRGRYNAMQPDSGLVEAPEGPGTVNLPQIHARHNDRANVLWFDGHVSGETLTYVGTSQAPAETYKRLKIGHLVKGDIGPLDASYYFFFDKSARSVF